jgi:hypothetical protein
VIVALTAVAMSLINRCYRKGSPSYWAGKGRQVMHVKSTLISAAIIISSTTVLGSLPVQAQDRVTSEGQRLHQLCDGGDKGACVRFGMMFNENRARHDEWRRSHPHFFSLQATSHKGGSSTAGEGTNLPWCGVPYSSTRSCVYQTIAQCESDMRPLGGDCEPN